MAITPGYKKFKRYIFQEDENYILDSEWTHASTVELDGGKTLDQKMSEVDGEMSSLKKSVSDGKKKVADAITEQGVIRLLMRHLIHSLQISEKLALTNLNLVKNLQWWERQQMMMF